MGKRILYCVLDWGLGHATRSVPIIQSLLNRGCEVIIGSDGLALEFLRVEFSALNSYELPSYGVKYKSENLILNGFYNWNRIRSAIKVEHALIEPIVKNEKIGAIISDNRYGCYVPGIQSVMITHQLQFRTGNVILDRVGRIVIRKILKPFDRIWIPDDQERTLSGVLSMSDDTRLRCIGWQSTLTGGDDFENENELNDLHLEGKLNVRKDANVDEGDDFIIAAILSGPEPQRTKFEAEIRKQFASLNLRCALVRGVQSTDQANSVANITVHNILDRDSISQLMNSASIILCRTGYSSLMDLQTIGKKAILVPTPGQPEQRYLGERMKLIPHFVVQQQSKLNIKSAIEQLINKSIKPEQSRTELLDVAIEELFSPY